VCVVCECVCAVCARERVCVVVCTIAAVSE